MNEESISRKKMIKCRVCLKTKPREEMRKSSRGRIIRHCRSCRGTTRCTKCGKVKEDKNFKFHSARRHFFFDDGDKQVIHVCYSCDSKMYYEKRAANLKAIQQGSNIRDIIRTNLRRWRKISHEEGLRFDLSVDFLISLWKKQRGGCYYTGDRLTTNRGQSEWDDASLDRLNPLGGYVMGNVVWTSRFVNTSKGRRNVKEFVSFCKRVLAHLGFK